MTELAKVTAIHERTVQEAEGHAARASRKKPRATETRTRTTRAKKKVRVDPRVMAEARKLLASRPGTKLRIVSSEEVVVE